MRWTGVEWWRNRWELVRVVAAGLTVNNPNPDQYRNPSPQLTARVRVADRSHASGRRVGQLVHRGGQLRDGDSVVKGTEGAGSAEGAEGAKLVVVAVVDRVGRRGKERRESDSRCMAAATACPQR